MIRIRHSFTNFVGHPWSQRFHGRHTAQVYYRRDRRHIKDEKEQFAVRREGGRRRHRPAVRLAGLGAIHGRSVFLKFQLFSCVYRKCSVS